MCLWGFSNPFTEPTAAVFSVCLKTSSVFLKTEKAIDLEKGEEKKTNLF